MKLNKLIILLIVPVLLTACGGEEEVVNDITAVKQYHETDSYIISDIPIHWEVIKTGDLTSNVPSSTAVAFRNNIKNEIFTANANVVTQTIKDEISSKDLGVSNKALAKSSLLEFQEISTEDIMIKLGKEESVSGTINSFSGKKNALDPIIIFNQLNVVSKGMKYIITTARLEDEEEDIIIYLDEILRSFELK